jgi:hypothetical protein
MSPNAAGSDNISSPRTDPELLRQLEAASSNDQPVEAVIFLRPDNPSEIAPSPERTREITRKVLDRVESRTGSRERRYNVFGNMGSFVVSALPSFLKELLRQPEIVAAMANQQPGDAMIRPVKRRSVESSPKKARSQSKRQKSTPRTRTTRHKK